MKLDGRDHVKRRRSENLLAGAWPYPKSERTGDKKERRLTEGPQRTGGGLQSVRHSQSPSRDGFCVKPPVTEGGAPVDIPARGMTGAGSGKPGKATG